MLYERAESTTLTAARIIGDQCECVDDLLRDLGEL
jgi:hypothetical protein